MDLLDLHQVRREEKGINQDLSMYLKTEKMMFLVPSYTESSNVALPVSLTPKTKSHQLMWTQSRLVDPLFPFLD